VPKKNVGQIKKLLQKFFTQTHTTNSNLLHNIKILFCGDATNAEKMALALMRKAYEYYGQPKKDI